MTLKKHNKWASASAATLQATAGGYGRFRQDKLGVSVHFGLYSIFGQKEWTQNLQKIPREVYARRQALFNPDGFNAEEWLDCFTAAGATAFMVTTKHHDGFCLFDSKFTDFTSAHAPIKRDLIAELAAACHKRNVAFHLYYSLIDWHHPLMSSVEFEPPKDFGAYSQFMFDQISELCTQYGPIAGFLFDGWWPEAKAATDQTDVVRIDNWPLTELYDMIHRLQPEAMITNNHHVLPLAGEDYQVWEIDLPGHNTMGFNCEQIGERPLMAWMTSTATGWSWQPDRNDYLTPEKMRANFEGARKLGASMFQNLGPLGNGTLNPVEIELLKTLTPLLS